MHNLTRAILILILILTGASARAADPVPLPLPDNSLYQLKSPWQRDDGKTMRLADLRGEVRVVSLFFTGCENLCPMLLGQLKSLDQSMPAELKGQVGFLLVTMDSRGDSPATLKEYRRKSDLAPDHWVLARGTADDTREFAALLGAHYTPKQEDGQMGHTGLIAILDREGRIVSRATDIPDQKAFLENLARIVAAKP